MAFFAHAQFVGPGFYRVHNVGSDSYISIKGTRFEKTTRPDAFWSCILMQKEPAQHSDVGSIIYIPAMGQTSLCSQGVSTYSLTGLMLEIDTATVNEGGKPTYVAKTKYENFPCIFRDYGNGLTAGFLETTESRWWIEPVNEESMDSSYLGLQPVNAAVADADGYYWATMCCDFPFFIPLDGGVEGAYTIKEVLMGDDGYYYAAPVKVCGQDETLPAATPVLLKCKSPDIADNKVVPTGDIANRTAMPIVSDLLMGNYFSIFTNHAHLTDYSITTEYLPQQSTAACDENLALMVDDEGKLCFVPQDAGTYMAANTAWLNVKGVNLEGALKVYLGEAPIVTIIQGDIDGNGELSIKDVTLLINYLLIGGSANAIKSENDGQSIDWSRADLNGDGEISITDVTLLLHLILTGALE